MIKDLFKTASDVGSDILAAVNIDRIKETASKARDAVADFFSGPDISGRKAPHTVIDGLDTVEDYVYLKSDADFVVALSKRIEHDLRYILGYEEDNRALLKQMLDAAYEQHLFKDDPDLFKSLNSFRCARNKVVHGEASKIQFKFRLEWTLAAFKLEESDAEGND